MTKYDYKNCCRLLSAVSKAVSSYHEFDELFPCIHGALAQVLDAENFYIALRDRDGGGLVFPYARQATNRLGGSHASKTEELALEVIHKNQALIAREKEIKKRIPAGIIPKVWMGVPLQVKGAAMGLLSLQHYSNSDQYGRQDLDLLTTVAEQVALAVERRMNAEVSTANEARYRTILDNIVEGYYEVDTAGTFTFFNDSMCAILGYSARELLGMNYREFMDVENAKKVFLTFNDVYKTGKVSHGFDWVLSRKDGGECIIETSVAPIRNNKNEPIGFRGIARDITARKQAEEEKKQMEKQLQYARRMKSIGTLAGGVAHNFNNLLMAIQGYTSMLLLKAEPDSKAYKMLQNIEKQITAGAHLTSQLLGYAREGNYEIEPINLNDLVKEISASVTVAKKGVQVQFLPALDLAEIIADRGQMEQVLMNLFVNALEAMPRGGELKLKTENLSHHEIQTDRFDPKPGSYVCLTVQDTGVGMDAATLEHIFEPFFTTKEVGKGSGLGLASTYGIVKAHGGYLQVRSQVNAGSTFYVFLPAAHKRSTAGKRKKKSASA